VTIMKALADRSDGTRECLTPPAAPQPGGARTRVRTVRVADHNG
jgi:hypothetical protein